MSKRLLLVIVAVLGFQGSAFAQWTERPYAPPIGSKWLIDMEDNTVQTGPQSRTRHVKSRREVSFDEKLPSGYRITYAIRDLTISGTDAGVRIAGPAMEALEGMVLRATLDERGRPVSIENLEELRAAMRGAVDRIVQSFADRPAMARTVRELLTSLLLVEGAQAAREYLDDLAALAPGHNTGLRPGDTKRGSEERPSPLGRPMKVGTTTKIEHSDATGNETVISYVEALDPEAVKEFANQLGQQLLKGAGGSARGLTAADLDRIMKTLDLRIDGRTVFSVQNGMVRRLEHRGTMRASAQGQSFLQEERKTIVLTRAQ